MTGAQYVYALARRFAPAALAGLTGIDAAPVHQIGGHADVVAVASAAPPEALLRNRLERLDDLARIATAHHAVVAATAELTVTAPLRLATVYQNRQRVRDMLDTGHAEHEALLSRLAGTAEIGVKVYLPIRSPDRQAPSGSGRDYLHQLSRRQHRRDEDWAAARTAADSIDTALAAHALASSHHRPQPAQLSGAAGHNILNAAYLVPAENLTGFTDLAHRLGRDQPGIRLQVTGPWAPYSFTGDRP